MMVQSVERSAMQILELLTGEARGAGAQSLETSFEAIRSALQAALGGGGSGGGAVIESDWVQITDAEFKALSGTPKTLVAAGGAGVVRIPTKWLLYFKTMVSAYADGGELKLISSAQQDYLSEAYIPEALVVGGIGSAEDGMLIASGEGVAPDPQLTNSPIDNQAVQLFVDGPPEFTGGNAGNLIYAKVWYVEVTLP